LRKEEESKLPEIIVQYAKKGKALTCKLKDVDPDGELASHVTLAQLERAYVDLGYHEQTSATGSSIPAALNYLELPTDLGTDLKGFVLDQHQDFDNGTGDGDVTTVVVKTCFVFCFFAGDKSQILTPWSVRLQVTFAHFYGVLSPKTGYISAEDNEGPLQATNGRQLGPEPRRVSDVYFLMWKKYAKPSELHQIKYFVRNHAINKTSKQIAVSAVGDDIPEWANHKDFDMKAPQRQAILASPNGSAIAWFLINHKNDLGVKAVTKVSVFKTIGRDVNGQAEDWLHFIFYIGEPPKKGRK
jgi:hypothetical protein